MLSHVEIICVHSFTNIWCSPTILFQNHLNVFAVFLKFNTPTSEIKSLLIKHEFYQLIDTMEKELMGMRTKKNWSKTILELDDEIDLKQMLL